MSAPLDLNGCCGPQRIVSDGHLVLVGELALSATSGQTHLRLSLYIAAVQDAPGSSSLVKGLSLRKHFDDRRHTLFACLRLFGGLQAPRNRVNIRFA